MSETLPNVRLEMRKARAHEQMLRMVRAMKREPAFEFVTSGAVRRFLESRLKRRIK